MRKNTMTQKNLLPSYDRQSRAGFSIVAVFQLGRDFYPFGSKAGAWEVIFWRRDRPAGFTLVVRRSARPVAREIRKLWRMGGGW